MNAKIDNPLDCKIYELSSTDFILFETIKLNFFNSTVDTQEA